MLVYLNQMIYSHSSISVCLSFNQVQGSRPIEQKLRITVVSKSSNTEDYSHFEIDLAFRIKF